MITEGKIAVIDCGTNTFHLLISEYKEGLIQTLYREKIPVKIGEGGINQRIITEKAAERGLNAIRHFKSILDSYNVTKITCTATSAIRNASNGKEFVKRVYQETGIDIQVISGLSEAELIYRGVREAVSLDETPALIVDIGGGSVEFVICNQEGVLWKNSFEIGGQRLLDLFHKVEPIPASEVVALVAYLEKELKDLTVAVEQFKPEVLIGSSGSFDTLCEIYYKNQGLDIDIEAGKSYALPIDAFIKINDEILTKDRQGRLAIPGMLEMRVDMIVACLLLNLTFSRPTKLALLSQIVSSFDFF
jgi:exopolyphosphatase/guanosine-5'-triphosphate,3'-diphosphate pyrophosphatase